MKKKFLFFVALACIPLWVICSRAWARAGWTTYTKADGLAGNVVSQVFEDSKENMWFATGEGVSKYDGLRWITFTEADGLASNLTTSIWQDPEGHIWVGAFGGLSKYDGITWTTLKEPFRLSHWVEAEWETHKISKNTDIRSIRGDSRGNIWIGTEVGLLKYDGNRWGWFYLLPPYDGISPPEIIPPGDWRVDRSIPLVVHSIFEDNKSDIWFGTRDGAVKYDGETWKVFTRDDGLADSNIGPVCADTDGNMWFGTPAGVTKYDGETWKTFTKDDGLADNAVYSICEDHQGNMWFGTAYGVSRYREGEWITFTIEDGLAHNRVLAIFEDSQGNIWFATSGGVSKYNNTTWMTLSTKTDFSYTSALPIGGSVADNNVRTMFKDSQGNIWIATFVGVSKYNGKSWTTFTTADGLASNTIWKMGEDAEGNIWFETDSGLTKFDGTTFTKVDVEKLELVRSSESSQVMDSQGNIWVAPFVGVGKGVRKYDGKSWTTFTTADGLASNYVTAICEDDEGNMWFGTDDRTGTDGMGVSRFDGVSWTTFTTANGLSSNFITAIVKDNGGSLWFGTIGGGVSIYDGKTWTALMGKQETDYDDVQVVYKDSKGYMWFATYGGLIMHDGSTWRTFTTVDGLPRDHVWSILEDEQGNMWFATLGGVCKYDGIRFKTFTVADGLPDSRVWAIAEDNQGDIWVGTEGGIARYDGRIWTPFTEKDGLVSNQVRSIAEDSQGDMWFGTLGGVSRYHGATWTTYTKENGLASNKVISVVKDSHGNMWFGTWDGGVSKYDGASWQTFTTPDGLASNFVWPILEDSQGNMWFGTDSGVSKFDGATWVTFTIIDGLSSNDIQSICEDRRDNIIWFGTLAGVHRHQIDMVPPKVAIIAGPDDNGVVADNSVVFVYKGGDLITPSKDLLYSVWPDPNRPFPKVPDSNNPRQWSPYSSATTASLTNLPDGEHVFWVTVKDKDLNAASVSRRFTIDTQPPKAFISSPVHNQVLGGVYTITGVATDKDFQQYCLEAKRNADGAIAYSQTVQEKVENGALGTWDTRELNGKYTVILRVTSVKGTEVKREFESTDSVTVTLDNTPPIAKLIAPLDGSRLTKKTSLVGEVSDHHLDGYVLEYTTDADPNTALWRQVFKQTELLQAQTSEVQINHEWEVPTITGAMFVRLTAIDAAGNTDAQVISVEIPPALTKERGGEASSSDGYVSLYIPPRGLPGDIIITINRVADEEIAEPSNPQLRLIGRAYDIGPGDLALLKPATFTMSLDEDDIREVSDLGRLAIFTWSVADSLWQRVGGTADEGTEKITVALTRFGRFAVMEDLSEEMGKLSISDVHCQPRVFSPKGGGYDVTTTISFNLGKRSQVTVKVYDVSGRFKRKLVEDRTMNIGSNALEWDGRDYEGKVVVSGMYVVTVEVEGKVATKTIGVLNR